MIKLEKNGKEYAARNFEDGFEIIRCDGTIDENCGFIGIKGLTHQIKKEIWKRIGDI